jgi:hypothetical protein
MCHGKIGNNGDRIIPGDDGRDEFTGFGKELVCIIQVVILI